MKTDLANKIFSIITSKYKDCDLDRVRSEIEIMEERDVCGDVLNIYNKIKSNQKKPGHKNVLNSLVGYLLGLTTKAPTDMMGHKKRRTYGRSGFPDIDMDFDHHRRHEVAEYLFQKYGRDKVSNIGTIQRLTTKNCIHKTIMVLDPDRSVVFDEQGNKIKEERSENFSLRMNIVGTLPTYMKRADGTFVNTVKEAYEEYAEFRAYMDQYPEVYKVAQMMEGGISAFGSHAAGFVISPIPLSSIAPLHVTTGRDDEESGQEKTLATQFTAADAESLGLIKFDILGLLTKTVITLATKLIYERHGINIDVDALPLDDAETLALLKSAKTDGCFQLEEPGMQRTVRDIGIDTFDDVTVAIAMYRPGPLQFIPDYASRKRNPSSIRYIHPIVEKYTKKTYGIIVYQEQAMQIFVDLAGLTTSEGYIFIKGAAKKKPELFQSMKDKFIQGASKRSSKEIAEEVWRQMEPFQGYAFNKSLSHDQKIITSEKEYSIQELYNRKCRGEMLPSVYSQTGKMIDVVDVYDHGVLPVWEITFTDGSKHKSTLNHKFMTSSGPLPLHEILKGNLSVIKHCGVEHANKKRLGLQGLSSSVEESQRVQFSQEGMRAIPSDEKELSVSSLCSQGYSQRYGISQERLPAMAGSEIAALFGIERENVTAVLGQYQDRSRSSQPIQRENVGIGIGSNSVKFRRPKTAFTVNESTQYDSSGYIPTKSSSDCNQDFCQTGYSVISNGQSEKMEGRESRRIHREVYPACHETEEVAVRARDVSKGHLGSFGFQAFSDYQKSQILIHFKEKANRLYKQRTSGSCGIRWSIPFLLSFERRPHFIEESTERYRDKRIPSESWLPNDKNFVRLLVGSSQAVQVCGPTTTFKSGSVLPRPRSIENDWQEVRVATIRFAGHEQCYDLEVDSPDHLYCLSSGIVNSNSHAVSYAYESWKTAYLKAHYPLEFMAARLSIAALDRKFESVEKFEADCYKNLGIRILEPHINDSKLHYTITDEKTLRRPLAIKGIGDKAAEEIVKNQPYKGPDLIESFATKVGPVINTAVVEAMCDAGLFGTLKKAYVKRAFETVKSDRKKAKGTQTGDLFG